MLNDLLTVSTLSILCLFTVIFFTNCNKYITSGDRMSSQDITEYQPESEDIESYLEQIKLHFAANAVSEDKRFPQFVTLIGLKNYSI